MAFNTGNPVPSTDGRDLSDNAEALDKIVNQDPLVTTRTGKQIKSISSIVNTVDAAATQGIIDINADVAAVDASADEFDILALDRLNKIGVVYDSPIRDWSPSLLVDDLRAHRNPPATGDIYIPTKPLPFTTGAVFNIDDWELLQGITDGDIINDLSQAYTFKTVALMQSSLIVFPDGKKIFWQGYNAESDGGSNWGIVKSGAHVADGGSIFTLADGKFVEANLKGTRINILKFGAVDDANFLNAGTYEWFSDAGLSIPATDNSPMYNSAIALDLNVHTPEGNFFWGTHINIGSIDNLIFSGAGANYAGTRTSIKVNGNIVGAALTVDATFSGITIRDIEFDGARNITLDTMIQLKDDGASLNHGNTIKNVRIKGLLKLGAIALDIQAWGTNVDNVWIRQLKSGTGVKIGAGGVSGTTQLLNRVYIGEVDTCIHITATSLGVAITNPIMEASVVGIFNNSNYVSVYNPYFEKMGVINATATGRKSIVHTKSFSPFDGVEGVLYCEGKFAHTAVKTGYCGSFDDLDEAILAYANTHGKITIEDMELHSQIVKSSYFIETLAGTISVTNPRWHDDRSQTEALRGITYFKQDGDTSAGGITIEGKSGRIETSGADLFDKITRVIGDRHEIISASITKSKSETVIYDANTTVVTASGTAVTVTDAKALLVGDLISMQLDTGAYHYSDIAALSGDDVTLSDAIPSAAAANNLFNGWRWSEGAGYVLPAENPKALPSGGSVIIQTSLPGFTEAVVEVGVVITTGNSLKIKDTVYIEFLAGAPSPVAIAVNNINNSWTVPTYTVAVNATNNALTLTVNEQHTTACEVASKVIAVYKMI